MNPPAPRRSAAFSMIELLAAMAVLSIIVLIVSRLFTASSNMWSVGNQRVQQATNARAALDFMANEIGAALSDPVVGLKVENGTRRDMISNRSDILSFTTLTQKPDAADGKREARMVTYHLEQGQAPYSTNRFNLARGRLLNTPAMNAYNPPSPSIPNHNTAADDLLIVNVAAFQARVYVWNGASLQYVPNFQSDASTNAPAAIELVLGLLSDEEARRQDSIGPINNAVRRAAVRWYSTVIHLRQAQALAY